MNDRQTGDSIAELQDVHDGLSLLKVLVAMAAVEEPELSCSHLFVVLIVIVVIIVWMQWVIGIEEEISQPHWHCISTK